MNKFSANNEELMCLICKWGPILASLDNEMISNRKNLQNRTIKQIVGHMIDSASNNTHRIIHLQYQPDPLIFPDYANNGNNDRWIAIQNYQTENWHTLVQLWKYSNFHIVHVIENVDNSKLNNQWISALMENVSLHDMISDYLKHIKLHLNEIAELMKEK